MNASCTAAGKADDMPWTYISVVSRPSGSKKSWCRSLSLNRISFDSMDGQ